MAAGHAAILSGNVRNLARVFLLEHPTGATLRALATFAALTSVYGDPHFLSPNILKNKNDYQV
jgi:hypothetical protein